MCAKSDSFEAPFFIVGCGRSGTTLLRMILSGHSRIAIPPETWFFLDLVKALPLEARLTEAELEQAIDIVTSHYRWPDMNMSDAELRKRAATFDKPRLREFVEIIYQHHVTRENKRRWGDKTPPYIHIVPELSNLYPEAKFIHLIRDGRDVAKSFFDLKWQGPRLYKNTTEWKESIDCIDRYAGGSLRSRLLEVRYEELVIQTERTTRVICNFLEESFEPQMLDWRQVVSEHVPGRESAIHKKLLRKPKASDVGRWRHELSNRQIFIVESFLGSRLSAHGYDVKFRSPLWKPLLLLSRWGCRLISPAADFVVRAFRFVTRRLSGSRP